MGCNNCHKALTFVGMQELVTVSDIFTKWYSHDSFPVPCWTAFQFATCRGGIFIHVVIPEYLLCRSLVSEVFI